MLNTVHARFVDGVRDGEARRFAREKAPHACLMRPAAEVCMAAGVRPRCMRTRVVGVTRESDERGASGLTQADSSAYRY